MEPTNYALVENGVVTNIIWLCPSNAGDFPCATSIGDRLVAVGDAFENGVFTRGGVPVPTEAERLLALENGG